MQRQQTAESIKAWIAYDLPPAEKESLSPAHLDALIQRLDPVKEPVKETPKEPAKEPVKAQPVAAKPVEKKAAPKSMLKAAKSFFKTSKPKAKFKKRK